MERLFQIGQLLLLLFVFHQEIKSTKELPTSFNTTCQRPLPTEANPTSKPLVGSRTLGNYRRVFPSLGDGNTETEERRRNFAQQSRLRQRRKTTKYDDNNDDDDGARKSLLVDYVTANDEVGYVIKDDPENIRRNNDNENIEKSNDNQHIENSSDNEHTDYSNDNENAENSNDEENIKNSYKTSDENTKNSNDNENIENCNDNKNTENSNDNENTENNSAIDSNKSKASASINNERFPVIYRENMSWTSGQIENTDDKIQQITTGDDHDQPTTGNYSILELLIKNYFKTIHKNNLKRFDDPLDPDFVQRRFLRHLTSNETSLTSATFPEQNQTMLPPMSALKRGFKSGNNTATHRKLGQKEARGVDIVIEPRSIDFWESNVIDENGEKGSHEGPYIARSIYDSCGDLRCYSGAKCVEDQLRKSPRCQCPLGVTGDSCERTLVGRYPRFLGDGFMAFPALRTGSKEFNIIIRLRPETANGLILFSADQPDASQDFFSVSIIEGTAHFRFDCGSGRALLRSSSSVRLNDWNTLIVRRSGRYGWLRLNEEQEVRGRSKGSLSRIGMRGDLFLGGYSNVSVVGGRTGMSWGFVGCVSKLVVNGKDYDMRRGAYVGDAIYGLDVGDCSDHVCDGVICLNGGSCSAVGPDEATCRCPLGTTGSQCQTRVDLVVPRFFGHSYVQLSGLRRTAADRCEIVIVLKPYEGEGLILYNGYSKDRSGDFISVALREGHVECRFNLGTGASELRSRQRISLNDWHLIRISRTGRNGILFVDDQLPVEGQSQGAFTQLTLTLDLFIGGHRNYDETTKAADVTRSFNGCIQRVVINDLLLRLVDDAISGINVDNCDHLCVTHPCRNAGHCVPVKDSYKCACKTGYHGSLCEEKTDPYRYRFRYRRAERT